MPKTAKTGEFSVGECYTLDEIASKLDRPKRWVYETLIRPTDHATKELLDFDGSPLRGVSHVRSGTTYLISGQKLLTWIESHSEQIED